MDGFTEEIFVKEQVCGESFVKNVVTDRHRQLCLKAKRLITALH